MMSGVFRRITPAWWWRCLRMLYAGCLFMAVTAINRPDFRTISDFRKRHLSALADLFLQVLLLCRAAGLVQLGHVAIDGQAEGERLSTPRHELSPDEADRSKSGGADSRLA